MRGTFCWVQLVGWLASVLELFKIPPLFSMYSIFMMSENAIAPGGSPTSNTTIVPYSVAGELAGTIGWIDF